MKPGKVQSVARWIGVACVTLVLAACGGGGGDPGQNPPPPTPDARSGDYTLMAANGREYTLAVDFDTDTWRVTGNGVDQGGTIAERGSEFLFQPGNSVGANGTITTRFTVADGAIVGEVALPEGALPFIAPRVFETTVAAAAGRYNMLGRTVSADGSDSDTTIQQGEITAAGVLRTCEEDQIFEISTCPTVSTGTVTVDANGLFTAQTAAGNVLFRVARIGGDRVFVRASPSTAGSRRFVVGTPATTSFATGIFAGGTTEPAWGTVAIAATTTPGNTTFIVTGVSPQGVSTSRTGTATALGAAGADSRASLLGVDAGSAGIFFVTRSTELGVVVAQRGSTTARGFMAIGKSQ